MRTPLTSAAFTKSWWPIGRYWYLYGRDELDKIAAKVALSSQKNSIDNIGTACNVALDHKGVTKEDDPIFDLKADAAPIEADADLPKLPSRRPLRSVRTAPKPAPKHRSRKTASKSAPPRKQPPQVDDGDASVAEDSDATESDAE